MIYDLASLLVCIKFDIFVYNIYYERLTRLLNLLLLNI